MFRQRHNYLAYLSLILSVVVRKPTYHSIHAYYLQHFQGRRLDCCYTHLFVTVQAYCLQDVGPWILVEWQSD
jgi:hypothetical protein